MKYDNFLEKWDEDELEQQEKGGEGKNHLQPEEEKENSNEVTNGE